MDRDMDAIRRIALALKAADTPLNGVPGLPDDVFKYNGMLMIEAGLAVGLHKASSRTSTPVPAAVILMRLTWDGHDFADSVVDETVWKRAKEVILKPAGSWTFKILKMSLEKIIVAKAGDLVGL